MPYIKIRPSEIKTAPLAQRQSKSFIEEVTIDPESAPSIDNILQSKMALVAERIIQARSAGASVILAFGAHLVKNGTAAIVIRMMERGWLTHLATQGAGSIHDWEFAFLGRSEEDVRKNVAQGQFGTWEETGRYINLAVQLGAINEMGYGESLGALIEREEFQIPEISPLQASIAGKLENPDETLPAQAELLITLKKHAIKPGRIKIPHPYKRYSLFAAAYRLGIPITVHCGIGYDIIYNHPMANGAALGRGSHIDFQIFAKSVSDLSNGVFLSIGSAIMAPQVFEKAVSIVNNIRKQHGLSGLSGHHTVINDLQPTMWDWQSGEPPKSSPDYYLRFLKSFYRMGGTVEYIAADNRLMLHHLYHQLMKIAARE